jgi:hypothetical protein
MGVSEQWGNDMSKGGRIYEANRRLAEIINTLYLLDELEKEHSAPKKDAKKTAEEWTPELKEAYDLRPELEAEREELEKELACLLKQHPPER